VGDANRARGAHGEALAAHWYEREGYVVAARNWRCREGELDLVVTKGALVVVCEVKARRTEAFGSPMEAVTAAKQARVRKLAARWLREVGGPGLRGGVVRFDVASVVSGRLTVVEGAF
jgi:putative endonuclease